MRFWLAEVAMHMRKYRSQKFGCLRDSGGGSDILGAACA